MIEQDQPRTSAATTPATHHRAPGDIPRTRRISFRFGENDASRKYFVHDDIAFSHFVAALSASFPPGEESFIRAVHHYAGQITDPVLKKRAAGFIGQESTHGREHRRVNEKLIESGYPIRWWDSEKLARHRLRVEQRLGPQTHLAATAAAEHFTALLAERILSSNEIQTLAADPEILHLLNWHALEELEHKSVAFDVYRAVGGTERARITTMAVLLGLSFPILVIVLTVSLARDPIARRQPLRLLREMRAVLRGPLIKGLMPQLIKYLRPGFHPNDIDTAALLTHWQAELFGANGGLVDHLK